MTNVQKLNYAKNMEYFEIILSGVFGWSITFDEVVALTKEANGKPLKIKVASPGGSVSESVAIAQHLAGYQQETDTQIVFEITGWAQSAAGFVLMVPGAKVVIFRNSALMIHNPINCVCGDYRAMQKNGSILESLAENLAKTYAAKSGKEISEVRAEMDEETFLFGEEIVEAGYADEYVDETVEIEDKTEAAAFGAAATGDRELLVKMVKERAQSAMMQSTTGHVVGTNEKQNGSQSTGDIQMSKPIKPGTKPETTPDENQNDDQARMSACIGAIKAFPKDVDMLKKAFDDGRSADFFAGFMARQEKTDEQARMQAASEESPGEFTEKNQNDETAKMSGDKQTTKTPGLTGGVARV